MLDFVRISEQWNQKTGVVEITPDFILCRSTDLMIRGNDFYAIWDEVKGHWTTDEQDAIELIDRELDDYVKKNEEHLKNRSYKLNYVWDTKNKVINKWREFCTKQARNYSHDLDEKLIFANDKPSKRDFSSHSLSYPLEEMDTPCYDLIMSTLYSEEERHKLEWAIGSIVNGDSKHVQKFVVLYGSAGTGKSTVLNIIEKLFKGYTCVFDAKALGSAGASFALEPLKDNPLVAIQHDGKLDKIEDNTRLNSIVSHEKMTVNEKRKSQYSMSFRCFLFLGTNNPVKITDGRSGLLRRLIDVSPTGNKLSPSEYRKAYRGVDKELGGIAWHCREVYEADPQFYDDYRPINMMGATDEFYNFVAENFNVFKKNNGTTLKEAWSLYDEHVKESNILHKLSKNTTFKEELKNYFDDFHERYYDQNTGQQQWNVYEGFKVSKFETPKTEAPKPKKPEKKSEEPAKSWLCFNATKSLMDDVFKDCPAQYAVPCPSGDRPKVSWANNTVTLKDIDTSQLHYLKPPSQFITIDFDIPDENGNKSLEKNMEAASKWPPTYAELSKSGAGIHLEYLYSGDVSELANLYEEHVEIKVFLGGSSLRRKVSKCNDIPIAEFTEPLPKKPKGVAMIAKKVFKAEQDLIDFIAKAIEIRIENGKQIVVNYNHAHAPNIQFIYAKLNEAYESGLHYDVTALRPAILAFAASSRHQAEVCTKLVAKMPFKSDDCAEPDMSKDGEKPLIFWDVEVYPNLFVFCWSYEADDAPVNALINPTSEQVRAVIESGRMVGFNNRRYDNHITYAQAYRGYTPLALYKLSQSIIVDGTGFFGEAYNLSYTDIYDYASTKQSLKKWEIELGIHHQECPIPWNEEVPKEKWGLVADYCCNDVRATKATWKATAADFVAREILAEVAGMTVNDTTNSLTTRIIFGKNRNPQDEFNYRDMGDTTGARYPENLPAILHDLDPEYTLFDDLGRPVFPGYKYDMGKSTYRGEEVGEGGCVRATVGLHCLAALLDIASMHPTSIEDEELFGPVYTKRFSEIKLMRIYIKHKEFDKAKTLLGGALAKYLDDPSQAKKLAFALKIVINSVYGLTSAKFPNPFRDPRNADNIVAKRGALFMINLKHEVERRGFTVAHIKTDSIKIPDATPEIIEFVMAYGRLYGYTFEHEATYDRMCLVNDAVYIAKYASKETCVKLYGEEYINSSPEVLSANKDHNWETEWTATGAQFAVPYVFKTLFSHEELNFLDFTETKSASTALYLDFNEGLPYVGEAELVKALRLKPEGTKMTRREVGLLEAYSSMSNESIQDIIDTGHNMSFVGKVGLFVPVIDGCGGGILLREKDGAYNSAGGAKDWRWKEAEVVQKLGTDEIDMRYFEALNKDAIDSINAVCKGDVHPSIVHEASWFGGDFDWFVSDEEYIRPKYVMGCLGFMCPDYPDEIPFN